MISLQAGDAVLMCGPPSRAGVIAENAMFIGHFAVGFASKRLAPRTSLGLLMAAPLFLDLLWPILLLANVEHARGDASRSPFLRMVLYDYPWSHSLLMCVAWSALAG